jgi:hypothetical protein
MYTVGISVGCGAGKVGRGPTPALSGNVATSPQPARFSIRRPANKENAMGFCIGIGNSRNA